MIPRCLRRPLSAVLGIERVDLTPLSVDEEKRLVSLRMRRMPSPFTSPAPLRLIGSWERW
jgi:hypothetical protein